MTSLDRSGNMGGHPRSVIVPVLWFPLVMAPWEQMSNTSDTCQIPRPICLRWGIARWMQKTLVSMLIARYYKMFVSFVFMCLCRKYLSDSNPKCGFHLTINSNQVINLWTAIVSGRCRAHEGAPGEWRAAAGNRFARQDLFWTKGEENVNTVRSYEVNEVVKIEKTISALASSGDQDSKRLRVSHLARAISQLVLSWKRIHLKSFMPRGHASHYRLLLEKLFLCHI